MIKLPVHLKIDGKVRPAVTFPDVTTRNTGKRNRGPQRQPRSLSLGNQNRVARHARHIAAVAPASYLKMRSAQGVKPQFGEERLVAGEPSVLKNTGQVRIGDDLFDNGIMPAWIRIRTAVSQA